MREIKSLMLTVAFLFVIGICNASAYTFLEDWGFDADGAGGFAPISIGYLFDTVGYTTATNTYTSATDFNFIETATFSSPSYLDKPPATVFWPYAAGAITANFVGAGTGTISGDLTFTSGTLDMFYNAVSIGQFNLIKGYGLLDGSAVPNGALTTIFEAVTGTLASGVWFDSVGGTDLSTMVPQEFLLGFATTNASVLSNTGVVNGVQVLELSNNGQFKLAVVPEPSTFLLLGGGLLGLGFYARRKKQ